MNESPVITMKDLSFAYDGGEAVLDGVSLETAQGDFAALIGPNGGGKTTLLKLMLGLLRPVGGEVRVFGRTPAEVRLRVGYMPQHARLDPQFPVSVLDVVLMGRLGRAVGIGPYSRANRASAMAALKRVELDDLAARPFADLSGGQRQRALIARALACEPDLLLLDEPASNLDVVSQNSLYELLHELNETMTIVIVSHDMAFVSRFVQTVVCVNRTVDVHLASDIAGETISEMYGRDMKMIIHDHGRS